VYQDNVNYFRDLEVGRIDGVLTDTPIAQVNLAGNDRLRAAGAPFEPGYYAVAVPAGETNLLRRLDTAIEGLAEDGTLERIYTKYGQWSATQEGLRTWQPPVEVVRRQRSGLREWRTFLPMLLRAAVTTVWVTCGGMILAVTLGLALAIVKQYAPAPLRWMAVAYIEVFRGTPLLLQIYFIYFGLAQQLGLKLSAGAAAVLALGLNYAATEAENYRAGLLSVPRGQMEAALALGMKQRVALRRVLLPQALRISLPSVTNDFIAMFKDSSIVSVIALVELTKEFQIRAIDTGDYLGLGLMTAGIYLAMSWTASLGARRIERMLHHDHR
jgi:polar amino acid transport system substrate-binding protein